MNTKEHLSSLDFKYVWHPFTQMQEWLSEEPLFIKRGEGNYLIDIEGNRYLDGVSSLWCNVHGHNRKELNEAIQSQLSSIAHSTMLGLSNIPATLLARELVMLTPSGLDKVFYSDNGATAVEVALKAAYQYWQQRENPIASKKHFIKLERSYHGDTIGSVSLGGIDIFHRIFSSLLFKTFSVPAPSLYHSSFSDEDECTDNSLSILKSILDEHHNTIAAFVIEPYVQGASGILVLSSYFMKEVFSLCKEYNVLVIADEVAVGFGRTGRMFACEEDDLAPDIMALGKGITGGYLPLAATLFSDEIYNAFLGDEGSNKAFYHGHTYTGNPLAASCALASLDIFKEEDTIESLGGKIDFLSYCLERFWDLDCIGSIRIKGFMVGIELSMNRSRRIPYDPSFRLGYKICNRIRKYGVILRPLGDTIVLMPPLSITKDEIKYLTDALYSVILEVVY